jgi:hypothetical protein
MLFSLIEKEFIKYADSSAEPIKTESKEEEPKPSVAEKVNEDKESSNDDLDINDADLLAELENL